MKKPLKFLVAVLALGMIFTSCAKNDDVSDDTETTGSTDTTVIDNTDDTPSDDDFKFESLSLGGTDISQYKIIYAQTSYSESVQTTLKNDYEFDRLTAERLAAVIKDNFGVELTVAADAVTPSADREILVGETNRTETIIEKLSTIDTDSYLLKMLGTRFIICGGEYGTTWHAIDEFENMLAKFAESKTANAEIASDYSKSGEYHLKTVACIGDSITYGSESTDPANLSYPANLQRILWKDYVVDNFGWPGTTMREDHTQAYKKSQVYSKFMTGVNKTEYDLALIMLGTNDGNRFLTNGGTWDADDDEAFISGCRNILDTVVEKSPDVKFVFMNCMVCYRDTAQHYSDPIIRELQEDTVDVLRSEGYNIQLYDMYSFSSNEMGKTMMADNLHPNDAGYLKMAEGVSELVKAVLEDGENKYIVVNSILINCTVSMVGVGKTLQLTSAPANVTWTSLDTSKATVDANGLVTGVSSGEVTIKASANGKEQTIVITVVADVLAVDNMNYTLTRDFACKYDADITSEITEVTVDGQAVEFTASSADKTLTVGKVALVGANLTAGGKYNMVIKTTDGKYYTCKVSIWDDVISTHEELVAFSNKQSKDTAVAGYYALVCDITAPENDSTVLGTVTGDDRWVATWSAAAAYEGGFRGTFDGQGYSVNGYKFGPGGLFGYVYTGGVVKNLKISGAVMAANGATLLGQTLFNGTISNCTFEATLDNVNYCASALFYHLCEGSLSNITINANWVEFNSNSNTWIVANYVKKEVSVNTTNVVVNASGTCQRLFATVQTVGGVEIDISGFTLNDVRES